MAPIEPTQIQNKYKHKVNIFVGFSSVHEKAVKANIRKNTNTSKYAEKIQIQIQH